MKKIVLITSAAFGLAACGQVPPGHVGIKAIEKWDGHLPQVTSGATPFLNLKE